MRYKFILISLLLTFFISLSVARDRNDKANGFQKPSVIGLLDTMNVNNIFLPFMNDGSTAEDAQAYFPNPGLPIPAGYNLSFLFQGGITASAFVDGELRCSWMAKASLIQEFQPGTWEGRNNPDDGRFVFYKVNASDGPGSLAYQKWADAVALGADYQDLNQNGVYDPDADAPDMLGDRISWCVINDGTDISVRSQSLQTDPIGLEVHQQVWAFARGDELGNVIFFRYRFINRAEVPIEDLIISMWTDPDIGDATDDFIGCDTALSLGYCYNSGDDPVYGPNPPAFGIDFFQGPILESPGDTAYSYRGPWFGVDTIPNFRNLPMTAFTFYNNDPTGQTQFPSPGNNAVLARRYQEGGVDGEGTVIDPTIYGTGGQANDPPQYFFAGDPFTQTGWLDIEEKDKRFMVNTGPFLLRVWEDSNGNGIPDVSDPGVQDIVVAYVVGQGNDPLESVNVMKNVDVTAQLAYNANFFVAGPPPAPKVDVRTFDNKIEFIIDLDANGTYSYDQSDELLNRQVFEGVKIYQMASSSTNEQENGQLNRRLIASYDIANQYKDIYQTTGLETKKIYSGMNNINTEVIKDSGAAVLRVVIDKDAFNQNEPLVNNTEYFFSVTAFSINQPFLQNLGGGAWVGGSGILLENNLGGGNLYRVIPNRDENAPFLGTTAEYTGERSFHDGKVFADVVQTDQVTGDEYAVRFFDNGNYWQIYNDTEGMLLRDSLVFQDTLGGVEWSFPIIDGLSIKVQNVIDGIDSNATAAVVDEGDVVWLQGSGVYSGQNTSAFGGGIDFIQNTNRSNLSKGQTKDKYFPVKLVFETSDNAVAQHYRASYQLSQGMKPTYVTAWDIRDANNPRQLYVAYVNSSATGTIDFSSQNPDFIVFNTDYQETPRYAAASSDTLFRKEGYMVVSLAKVSDSLFQANPMEIVVTPRYPNSDLDEFSFSSTTVEATQTIDARKQQLDMVNVVPNPYWAYSAYENSYDTPILKFTHLDREVTIRIFNLGGQLIKTLYKNDESNEMSWNLRNEANLKVASGMYIAHVEAKGVGSKVLKFAIIQREERIDRF